MRTPEFCSFSFTRLKFLCFPSFKYDRLPLQKIKIKIKKSVEERKENICSLENLHRFLWAFFPQLVQMSNSWCLSHVRCLQRGKEACFLLFYSVVFQVFNTYGSMGNAALLHRYGFTELDNPFDIVNIDLNLVEQWIASSFSNRYSRSRLSLWRRLGCSGCISQSSEYFEISSDGEPQLELLVLLYIIFLPEEAYQKLSNTISFVENVEKSINVLLSAKNSRISLPATPEKAKVVLLTESVSAALVSLADIRENLYGSNSLKDDIKALSKCCSMQEKNLYHSLVLRVSERKILKNLRSYASRRGRSRGRRGNWKIKGRWKRSPTLQEIVAQIDDAYLCNLRF